MAVLRNLLLATEGVKQSIYSGTLPIGQTVELKLSGKPSTGYGWQIDNCTEGLQAREEQSEEVGRSIPGGDTKYWRFFIHWNGSTEHDVGTCRFVYQRPWERVPPVGEVLLQLRKGEVYSVNIEHMEVIRTSDKNAVDTQSVIRTTE